MSEWQPIETAPLENGFQAIVYDPSPFVGVTMGRFTTFTAVSGRPYSYWKDVTDADNDGSYSDISPTHWMLLPDPPMEKTE